MVAGNQCHARGTLVATPKGPIAIEEIQPGDTVYDEHGKPIRVLKTFQNGTKEVADLTLRGMTWSSCTDRHVFQVIDDRGKVREKQAGRLGRDDKIRRVRVRAPLGNVRVPEAYALGALLGDGCSRQRGGVQLSSVDELVPQRVASACGGGGIRRMHESNYTWSLGDVHVPYYNEWCRGRYAHEKIVDLDVLRTWDRETLLQFVAGVIDTDGSIHPAADFISINVGMQAKSVIDAIEYAFLALWQVPLSRGIDERAKYKNGPIHTAYTRNSTFVREVLAELDPYLVSPQKKWRPEYETLGGRRTRSDCVGLKHGENRREVETFDIHVDSATNLYLLANGLVTHNSGKSALAAREIAWILNGDHPLGWTRPVEWGSGAITIIIAGQDRKMMEIELWNNKLARFLNLADWREVRAGQALTYVENRKTGDQIVFISHADSSEKNRKHMQGYVAHYVWLDEMPASIKVLEELQRRVDARNGFFLATFTPKFKNPQIKKIVDSIQVPVGKRYTISKFDNPIFAKHRERELAKLAGHTQSYIDAVLHGTWMGSDDMVYEFVPELHGGAPGDGYSPSWRHVLVVDPATESKLGLTLWAEDPMPRDPVTLQPIPGIDMQLEPGAGETARVWWCVRAEYVEGIYVPTKIIEEVERRVAGINIVQRRADTAASWYIRQAADMPGGASYKYVGIEHKNDAGRKDGLIKKFQEELGRRIRIADWCLSYIDELMSYERNPETGKLIKASKFHLIDCGHYFVDVIPEPVHTYHYTSFYDRLYHAHLLAEKQAEEAKRVQRSGGRRSYNIGTTQDVEAPLPVIPGSRARRGWRRKWKVQ